jgi:hypothetical protein
MSWGPFTSNGGGGCSGKAKSIGASQRESQRCQGAVSGTGLLERLAAFTKLWIGQFPVSRFTVARW